MSRRLCAGIPSNPETIVTYPPKWPAYKQNQLSDQKFFQKKYTMYCIVLKLFHIFALQNNPDSGEIIETKVTRLENYIYINSLLYEKNTEC